MFMIQFYLNSFFACASIFAIYQLTLSVSAGINIWKVEMRNILSSNSQPGSIYIATKNNSLRINQD